MPKVGMEPVRRKALVDAALKTIGHHGSLTVTMSEIAREAGVSPAGMVVENHHVTRYVVGTCGALANRGGQAAFSTAARNFALRGTFENVTDPKAETPELTFTANPPGALAKGMRFPATVELVQGDDREETVLLRSAEPAEVVITGFTEGGSGAYDRITATLTGTLCAPSGGGCVPMALRFETGVYQNDW